MDFTPEKKAASFFDFTPEKKAASFFDPEKATSGFVPSASAFSPEYKPETESFPTIQELKASVVHREYTRRGIKYYVLETGTKLYRAENQAYINNRGKPLTLEGYLPNDKPVYFGFHPAAVKQYGITVEYELVQPIDSIALDDLDTLNKLVENCNRSDRKDISTILRENYGAGATPIVRRSVKPNDFALINYLIDTYEVGGTIFEAETYQEGSPFHAEIALPQSQISGYLQINEIVTPDSEIPRILQASRDRKNSEALKKSRADVAKNIEYDSFAAIAASPPPKNKARRYSAITPSGVTPEKKNTNQNTTSDDENSMSDDENSMSNNALYFGDTPVSTHITPFRIEDAQYATLSPLITAHKVGVLNEKRCKKKPFDNMGGSLRKNTRTNKKKKRKAKKRRTYKK